jgi:predicted DNA-binding transcriptional regulator AlpA
MSPNPHTRIPNPGSQKPPRLVEQGWLTAAQVSESTGIAVQTLAHWRSTRRPDAPPFVKVGRLVRYERRALDYWMSRRSA